jgi:hypothetical protein
MLTLLSAMGNAFRGTIAVNSSALTEHGLDLTIPARLTGKGCLSATVSMFTNQGVFSVTQRVTTAAGSAS